MTENNGFPDKPKPTATKGDAQTLCYGCSVSFFRRAEVLRDGMRPALEFYFLYYHIIITLILKKNKHILEVGNSLNYWNARINYVSLPKWLINIRSFFRKSKSNCSWTKKANPESVTPEQWVNWKVISE